MVVNTSLHSLSKLVGTRSSGDDLPLMEVISFNTSCSVTGVRSAKGLPLNGWSDANGTGMVLE